MAYLARVLDSCQAGMAYLARALASCQAGMAYLARALASYQAGQWSTWQEFLPLAKKISGFLAQACYEPKVIPFDQASCAEHHRRSPNHQPRATAKPDDPLGVCSKRKYLCMLYAFATILHLTLSMIAERNLRTLLSANESRVADGTQHRQTSVGVFLPSDSCSLGGSARFCMQTSFILRCKELCGMEHKPHKLQCMLIVGV
ncbi:hypothetical protein PGT21_023299 [Puccinia graminis f. sp. tritici]|uniref:Uncharacterized protein n=1 Tax=Puccinia graminis f. sp. tritici TaxID=56615 RepID=A0A5B0P9N5_PUCGR|nr:hypothetical protein PGT21_023299 [Puccinia graminis f. sp. tritici]KAA1131806.1 hypothetical protein PGTUg99_026747 [Puccinia graminis f. sp. tritici]